jgi:hypothetical protein
LWKLVECFGVDDNGYAATPSARAGSGRHSYDSWVYRPVGDPEAPDYDPIMGRAVTVWEPAGGVRLAVLHPPEWVPWLGVEFYDGLRKLPNWFAFLEGGGTLYRETARIVGLALAAPDGVPPALPARPRRG